jgi:MFS family permease
MTVGLGAICVVLGGPVLVGERLMEGDNSGTAGTGKRSRLDSLLRFLPLSPPARALAAKDIRYVIRDLVLLSQIGIPVILFFVPFVIGSQLGNSGREELLLLMAGVIGTIVYMETSILSLSSVGLEGRAFWLVLCAPVSSALFVRAKWFFALFTALALCGPLVIVACWYYSAPLLWAAGGLLGLALACFSLCALGVGIAGLFPRFVYDNPAHRASLSALIWGFVGATAYLFIGALLVGGAVIGAQQWPEKSSVILAIGIGGFIGFSITTALVPLVAAERRLNGFAWEE